MSFICSSSHVACKIVPFTSPHKTFDKLCHAFYKNLKLNKWTIILFIIFWYLEVWVYISYDYLELSDNKLGDMGSGVDTAAQFFHQMVKFLLCPCSTTLGMCFLSLYLHAHYLLKELLGSPVWLS